MTNFNKMTFNGDEGASWSAKELEKRGAQPSSFWSALQSSSGDETYLCLRLESQWVGAFFKSPAPPGRPAELSGTAMPIAALHKWNHFERLWDTTSLQLLEIDRWEQTLQVFVKQVASSFYFIEDSISGARLELKKQTIYLESANRANERMDAPQLAKIICSGIDGKRFDRELAGQTNKGLLTIADAGSGKSWMIQQVALAICQLFERNDSDFVPLLLPVQDIFGSVDAPVVDAASSDIERFMHSFLKAKESIMGVDLSQDAMRLSLMQAFRARRY